MTAKEQLMHHIEEQRRILNSLLKSGGKVEEIYRQSLVVDALLEKYMHFQ